MDIGKEEEETIVVEPIVEPVRQPSKEPAPAEPKPEKVPERIPARTADVALIELPEPRVATNVHKSVHKARLRAAPEKVKSPVLRGFSSLPRLDSNQQPSG